MRLNGNFLRSALNVLLLSVLLAIMAALVILTIVVKRRLCKSFAFILCNVCLQRNGI